MSTALATIQPTAVAVEDQWTDARKEFVRNTYCGGAPDDIAEAFLAICQRRRLAPEERHIYLVKRGSKKVGEKWVPNWVIQTGIDGYRLIADRTNTYAGSDEYLYDSEDGRNPQKASATVWKLVGGQRMPFTASVRWDEYCPRDKDGNLTPTNMWLTMPYQMLGKCAESAALRKAFPAELSSIYTREEMDQAANPQPDFASTRERRLAGHAPGREAPVQIHTSTRVAVAERTVDTSTGEIIDAEMRPVDGTGSITQAQKDQVKELLSALDKPFSYANQIARPLFNKPVVRLTQAEGWEVINRLEAEANDTDVTDRGMLRLNAADKGVTDEGELRYALALLFTDFPDSLEEWSAAQLEHAAGWFAERDADAAKAAIEGAE